MKKLAFITVLFFVCVLGMQAQRANKVVSQAAVEVAGAVTVNTTAIEWLSGAEYMTLQAVCTQGGASGTPDGTLWLQGSVDGTSYVTVANLPNNDWVNLQVSDTTAIAVNDHIATISTGLVLTAIIKGSPFAYYRFGATGTSGDTTDITVKYIVKK